MKLIALRAEVEAPEHPGVQRWAALLWFHTRVRQILGCFAVFGIANLALAQPLQIGIRGNHQYVLTESAVSPQQGRVLAQTYCGYLATLNDAAENTWLAEALSGFGGNRFWIGLSDEITENVFVWDNGEPVIYTNWFVGEPNNNNGVEDWVLFYPPLGLWNDGVDGDLQRAIIEIPLLHFDQSPNSVAICSFGTANFSVVARGTGPLVYRWRWRPEGVPAWLDVTEGVNNDPFSGLPSFAATGSDSNIIEVNAVGGSWPYPGYEFQAVVTNNCDSLASNTVTLKIVTRGDMNCDCRFNGLDISPFVLALLDPPGFASAHPGCDILQGDINGDLVVDHLDVIYFVNCALAGACP